MNSFEELKKACDSIGKLSLQDFQPIYPTIPEIDYSNLSLATDFKPVNPEDTILGDINRNLEEQNSKFSQQIELLLSQNELLTNNYNQLKDLYDKQIQINEEANKELAKTKKYNKWMMIIAFAAMLAAVASLFLSFYLGILKT